MEESVATTRAAGVAPGAQLPDAFRLGPTRLIVTDTARSVAFYEDVIGIQRVDGTAGVVSLGTADGTVILELEEHKDARRAGRHAGLYHVALLFPDRAELARVMQRIARSRTQVDGLSDHGTHEAIYLPDPDGNGLELAADRPREVWPNIADIEEIRPQPLDLDSLLAEVANTLQPPARAADGLQVGHLHLHVGDIEQARAFYVDVVGFELIAKIPVAAFVSAGGYHHHLAFNTWRGEGVPPAPDNVVGLRWWSAFVPSQAGLDALERRLTDAQSPFTRDADGTLVLHDPWSHELRVAVDTDRA